MIVFAVDNEINALDVLTDTIAKTVPDAEIKGFQNGEEALEDARKSGCDVAFLDIEMPGINGLELAEEMKLINPKINIIFVTSHPEYVLDALSIRFSGYILKPVTLKKIRIEFDDLRHPIEIKKRVRFQTFGRFEVFIDGKPVEFKHGKTKEYLAYLVDKRAICSNSEIERTLFDSNVERSYIRHLRKDLTDILKRYGCEDIFIKQHGKQGILCEAVSCDYYDWLDDANTSKIYRGEYMKQYAWAVKH